MSIFKTHKKIKIDALNSPFFQYFAVQELNNNLTLASPVSIDDTLINMTPGHGFQIGEFITIFENSIFAQNEVINVAGNVITIDMPAYLPFSTNARVVRGNADLNVNGSVTPVDFLVKLYNSFIPIDIQFAIFQFQHGSNVPDDGKFTGISALTNGMFIRLRNSFFINFGIYRNNMAFKLRGAEINYSQKAPAGTYATEILIDIKKSYNRVVSIYPLRGDYLLMRVQDDLTPTKGISFARASVLGFYSELEI
jgi:hypothetical protein